MSWLGILVIVALLFWWLKWWLKRQSGVWIRRDYLPAGSYPDCTECGGMGMLKFPERRAFDEYERQYWSLEQMKARAVACNVCGGLERTFKPD